ncbi:MAG: polysaccharide deacetylase family protein [Ktedonobacteraceae bacterium]
MLRRVEMLIAACFYYSGLVQLVHWWKQRSQQSLVILCYHQAAGGNLQNHLLYLRRHYRILHLDAALEELYTPYKSESLKRDRRTPLVLTFDDGYHDHYTYGFALARELQIPITIFLVPGYIESGSRFWWQQPDHLVIHAQVRVATIEERTYDLGKLEERNALVQAINTRLQYATSITEREEFLVAVRKVLGGPSSANAEEKAKLPLTWAEVREMKESEWVSFGAHTMHHPILAYLADPTETQYEVSECRVALEKQLGYAVRTFAYPVGKREHIGENGLRAVWAAKYDWALTTIHGLNTAQTDPHLLHRIVVDVDQHWLMVAAKASGAWDFFVGLYRMPITLMRNRLALHEMTGLTGEYRTLEQLKEHYEIEKELATRLRESSREERRALYASLYDELFRRVLAVSSQPALHPSPANTARMISPQWRFLRRFLRRDAVFLELGAGDCTTALAAARFVKKVYALEVSEEITKSLRGPQNFELMLFDGCSIPLPAGSANIAYSHQVMEHLHPDDALEQLANIHKVLMSQGIYICVTPNRLSGPHDISKRFDAVATGFHLKEYTNTELSNLFIQAGFSKVKAYVGALGIYMRCPLFLLRLLEDLLDRLPHRLARAMARLFLLFNIRLAGIKK